MSAIKWLKLFFISIIVFIILILLIDPLKLLHKPYLFKDSINTNMRLQNAGIIRNYDFDSIILGTSMLENTSAVEASKLLEGNFANLSMSGSDFYERNIVLSYALKNKEIKKVIYSLDTNYNLEKKYNNYPLKTYDYLYDENLTNDFKIYCNSSLFNYITVLLKKSSKKTLEYPNAWFNSQNDKVKFGGIDNWLKTENNILSSIVITSDKIQNNEKISIDKEEVEKEIDKIKIYIDETIINNVSKYSNTEFIMIFPPYSRLEYALWKQYNPSKYEVHKAVIKYMVKMSVEYKNMKIYGFEDNDFLDDIANYKDLKHYHQSINSVMLNNFRNNIGLLTNKNIEKYLETSEQKALKYNIKPISGKINEHLKQLTKDK